MAKCPGCSREVSESATSCPSCGAQLTDHTTQLSPQGHVLRAEALNTPTPIARRSFPLLRITLAWSGGSGVFLLVALVALISYACYIAIGSPRLLPAK